MFEGLDVDWVLWDYCTGLLYLHIGLHLLKSQHGMYICIVFTYVV